MPYPSRSDVLTTVLYWLVATPFLLAAYLVDVGAVRALLGMG